MGRKRVNMINHSNCSLASCTTVHSCIYNRSCCSSGESSGNLLSALPSATGEILVSVKGLLYATACKSCMQYKSACFKNPTCMQIAACSSSSLLKHFYAALAPEPVASTLILARPMPRLDQAVTSVCITSGSRLSSVRRFADPGTWWYSTSMPVSARKISMAAGRRT